MVFVLVEVGDRVGIAKKKVTTFCGLQDKKRDREVQFQDISFDSAVRQFVGQL